MTRVSRKKELLDNMLKQEIVTTVLDLISREQPVTMDGIAAQCGVAKGTLYNYFKNKKELINYVHQTIMIPKLEKNRAILESEKPSSAKLQDFVDSVYNLHEAYPLYFQFVQSQRTRSEIGREKFEIVIHPLVSLCKEGSRQGVFVDLDPLVMASMIFGTVIGPLQNLQDREEKAPDMKKLKQCVVCLLDRMILRQQEKA